MKPKIFQVDLTPQQRRVFNALERAPKESIICCPQNLRGEVAYLRCVRLPVRIVKAINKVLNDCGI